MDDRKLSHLFENILKENFSSHQGLNITAYFKKRISLNHSIERKGQRLLLKISGAFREVPEEILTSLGIILFAKIFRYRVPLIHRQNYNAYVRNKLSPGLKQTARKPSAKYSPVGKHLDLDDIFDETNRKYFSNKIKKPLLGWSLNDSYTRLGFYSAEKNLLVISRIFDKKNIPEHIVYYLMFHEMLHIIFPVQMKNGRRTIHSREFRQEEKQFPGYDSIQKWLKKRRYFL